MTDRYVNFTSYDGDGELDSQAYCHYCGDNVSATIEVFDRKANDICRPCLAGLLERLDNATDRDPKTYRTVEIQLTYPEDEALSVALMARALQQKETDDDHING